MANIKFSAFTQLAPIDQTNSYIVGYEGDANTNNRWTFGEVAIGLKAVTATPYSIYSASGTLEATREVTFSAHDLKFIATGNGKLWYQDGNQAAGKVLKSDGDGEASWAVETDTNTTYAISALDGDVTDEEKIVLTAGGSGSGTSTVVLEASTGLTVARSTDKITFTNSSPDQTVALTGGTGITTSGTYPNFTITNSAPDQTVALNAGTGITTSGTYPNFTIANSAPNQATPAANDGSPSTGQLQYNDGSNGFAATSDMVYTTDQLKVQNTLYLDGNNANAGIVKLGCEVAGASHYVGLEGPNHSGNTQYNIKFPDATPSANRMLIVDSMASTTANMIWRDMYDANGTLTGARSVTMGTHNLTFAGSGTSKVTFSNLGGVEIVRDLTVQKNVIIQGQGYSELHTGVTTATFDWNAGNVQSTTLGAGTVAFAPTNPKAGATYIISIAQTGAAVINWGSYVKWPATGQPTLSGNAKTDVVTLICYDDSVGADRYYGSATLGFTS